MPKMDITLKALKYSGNVIDVRELTGVMRGFAVETAKKIRADLEKTTKTWKHKVIFTIKIGSAGSEVQATVQTDDEIYGWVTHGTKPHIIRPRNAKVLRFFTPYGAKTRVRWIGSSKGSRGNRVVYAKEVHHPGTKAREFHIVIAEKHQAAYSEGMQRRINNAIIART